MVSGSDIPGMRSVAARPAMRVAMLALSLALASCIGERGTSGNAPSIAPLPPIAQRAPFFEPAAAREHRRLVEAFGGQVRAPALERLGQDIVARLAGAETGGRQFRLTILNAPAVNAFALPSGDIYVTRGLLALANDSAELAAVIAHEMAHVTANHALTRAEQELKTALVSRVVSEVLNDAGAGSLLRDAARVDLAGFSRAQELEADRIGVRSMARSGFDPYGAVRFLNALGRNSATRAALLGERPGSSQPDFLSTHPATPERIALAMSAARQIGAPGSGTRGREAYLAAIEGLPFGEDPASGVVRGRRYLNPGLGIGFTAPEGYVMEVGAQAVIGVMPGGTQALRFDRLENAAGSPEAAIATGWIEGVSVGPIESQTISGLRVASATGRGQDWGFRFVAFEAGGQTFRLIFAARENFEQADRSFRATMQSVRALSPEDVARIRPLVLRTVAASPGDTAESLATRMVGVDRAVERFLILNGLERGQALTPGDRYKIVTE